MQKHSRGVGGGVPEHSQRSPNDAQQFTAMRRKASARAGFSEPCTRPARLACRLDDCVHPCGPYFLAEDVHTSENPTLAPRRIVTGRVRLGAPPRRTLRKHFQPESNEPRTEGTPGVSGFARSAYFGSTLRARLINAVAYETGKPVSATAPFANPLLAARSTHPPYLAYSTDRTSRITVTLISPGYVISS
jgi:hypothetical protein